MGLEDTKMFQVLSTGKIKELTEKEYLSRLDRKGYTVGWIFNVEVITNKPDKLTREMIDEIKRALSQMPDVVAFNVTENYDKDFTLLREPKKEKRT